MDNMKKCTGIHGCGLMLDLESFAVIKRTGAIEGTCTSCKKEMYKSKYHQSKAKKTVGVSEAGSNGVLLGPLRTAWV